MKISEMKKLPPQQQTEIILKTLKAMHLVRMKQAEEANLLWAYQKMLNDRK